MSDVVIRCPNCGTTQRTLGECDACHEADVRYFCSNHEPGRWLDGPVCDACGARYGVERARTSPPPPRTRTTPPAPRPAPTIPRDEPDPIPVDAWPGVFDPSTRPEVFEVETSARDPRSAWPAEPFGPGIRVVSASGCVRRLIMLIVVLLALGALFVFGILGIGARILFGASEQERPHWRAWSADEPAARATALGSGSQPADDARGARLSA